MTDIYSPEKRSEIMARVRVKGTKPEQLVRQIAHSLGYRFQLNRSDLPGKPDLVFSQHRKVILVHGCFWHGHGNCSKARRPISNSAFWEQKLSRNRERDQQNATALKDAGWQMMVIWECETRNRYQIAESIRSFFEHREFNGK